jgi:hypothetical protein
MDLKLPPLSRSHFLDTLITVLAIVIGWVLLWIVVMGSVSKESFQAYPMNVVFSVVMVASGLVAIFLCRLLLGWLTRPLARFWYRNLQTVGDLNKILFNMHYGAMVKTERQFNPDEITGGLRDMVSCVYGLEPVQITRESEFGKDLGW